MKWMASKSTRIPAKRCLKNKQERLIIDYITQNYQKNISLTLKHVEDAVNYILQEREERITCVGKIWAKQFQKRYLKLKRRRQRTLALERKNSFNIEELKLYFAQLKHVCKTFDIQISN